MRPTTISAWLSLGLTIGLTIGGIARTAWARNQPRSEAAVVQVPEEAATCARLPNKAVLLTFDDGPHPRHTDEIREILSERGIKAIFFEVGSKVGSIVDGHVVPTPAAAVSRRLAAAGFVIGNHTVDHAALATLGDEEILAEIDLANRILRDISGSTPLFFRAPYGEQQRKVEAMIAARGMTLLSWDIDSRDWDGSRPRAIAERVLAGLEEKGRGIVLFHDTHGQTVKALPMLLDVLIARGCHFVSPEAFLGISSPACRARPGK